MNAENRLENVAQRLLDVLLFPLEVVAAVFIALSFWANLCYLRKEADKRRRRK